MSTPRPPDMYRHLNADGDGAVVPLEVAARQIDDLNYGTHRFLSAIIRIRRDKFRTDDLADGLEALLNRGLY